MSVPGLRVPVLALGILIAVPLAVRADRFELAGGGTVEGTLLNRDESPRKEYRVLTPQGVQVTLPSDQVASVNRQSPAEVEYLALAPTAADTIEAQWKLAEWCRLKSLRAQRETHLRRIVELDPDHAPARRSLGYTLFKGEWLLPDTARAEKGLVLHRGKWRTAQDIALIEQREKTALTNKEWLGRLRRWRLDMDDPKLHAAAWKQMAEVRDPAAVPAMAEMLRLEATRAVKGLYIETLFEMRDDGATAVLMQRVLDEPDLEVFHLCADRVEQLKPRAAQEFYLEALKKAGNSNVRINRAAHLLGRLGDRTVASVLIDNLVTSHKIVVGAAGRGDSYSSTFDNTGGSNFSAGSTPRVLVHTRQNQEVLDALIQVTGGTSYGFDLDAWKRWLAVERARGANVKLKP